MEEDRGWSELLGIEKRNREKKGLEKPQILHLLTVVLTEQINDRRKEERMRDVKRLRRDGRVV